MVCGVSCIVGMVYYHSFLDVIFVNDALANMDGSYLRPSIPVQSWKRVELVLSISSDYSFREGQHRAFYQEVTYGKNPNPVLPPSQSATTKHTAADTLPVS
jgi:hypothetical protein